MVKQYETVFILTPVLSEDQAKEAAKKYKKLLTDNGAKIINEESWGLRKLAYPIQKKSTGFYFLTEYTSEGTLIDTLETTFKRDEKVLRNMTVSMDKHAIAYSEKRRNKVKEAKAEKREKKEKSEQV
jgi:small subunit ribosomal protein S6